MDTSSPPLAPTDLVGRTVGPYDLERLLGQGGFAWVFVGRELDGTPVAVKILKPRYAGDLQFESRFRNEAETAAQLRHPNIIHIPVVARSGNYVYFAMDLCADSRAAGPPSRRRGGSWIRGPTYTRWASRCTRRRRGSRRSPRPTGSSWRVCTSRIPPHRSERSVPRCPSGSSAW